jgi:hypothetical protein
VRFLASSTRWSLFDWDGVASPCEAEIARWGRSVSPAGDEATSQRLRNPSKLTAAEINWLYRHGSP